MKAKIQQTLLWLAVAAFVVWNWGPGSAGRKRDAAFAGIISNAIADGYLTELRCGKSGPVQVIAGSGFHPRGYEMERELMKAIWIGCSRKRSGVEVIDVLSPFDGKLLAQYSHDHGLVPIMGR